MRFSIHYCVILYREGSGDDGERSLLLDLCEELVVAE